jgi:hypothetical protein
MMQREAMMTKEFESGAVIAWGIVLEGKVRGPLTTLRSVAEGWKAYGYEVVGLRAVSAVAAEALHTSQPPSEPVATIFHDAGAGAQSYYCRRHRA